MGREKGYRNSGGSRGRSVSRASKLDCKQPGGRMRRGTQGSAHSPCSPRKAQPSAHTAPAARIGAS